MRIHGVFPAGVLGRRSLAKAVLRAPSLRTGEANLDTSRCADDGHGDSLHHPRWWLYLLCPFAQRFLKGILSVLHMYIWCASWCLSWVCRTNSSAPLLRVGKQMVLTAGNWEARLESPPQNLGTPSLCRRRVGARKLGVRDPTIQTPCWYMPRRRRGRRFFGRRIGWRLVHLILQISSCWIPGLTRSSGRGPGIIPPELSRTPSRTLLAFRPVGQEENARFERLRVHELQRPAVAPFSEETLPAP